jgi:nicotinamide-nucleotide amidase
MFDPTDLEAARRLISLFRKDGLKLAVAESCTGGLLATLLTEIPGASDVFDCGVVTYSNEAKQALLGVSAEALREHGAVSDPVAREMCTGMRARSGAAVAVAITGIAGPGGSPEKPAGLVFVAAATAAGIRIERNMFSGSRTEIRLQSVRRAIALAAIAVNDRCASA